jgi:hypothetical protein
MRLHMTEHQRGDATIVRLRGRLAPGPSEIRVWDGIRSLLARGHRHIVIDLAHASGRDASAVSTLLGALYLARNERGTVKLLHVTRGFDDLQIIVALYGHFDCHETEESALESFAVATRPAHPAIPVRLTAEVEVA